MGDFFDWDPQKAAGNVRKHWVTFEEATTAFEDSLSITIADPDHSFSEERFVLIGYSDRNRLLVVSHSDDGLHVRIISARVANSFEQKFYEEEP